MKPKRIKWILLATLALTAGASAWAQSNSVAGNTDYPSFTRFITERNIFDPNRYPRTRTGYRPRPAARTVGAPTFSMVGTMSYQKGLFVFFDGNNSDLKKILTGGGSIAGYTVGAITPNSVKLVGADKKEIELKLGDQMRQEGGNWQMAGRSENVASSSASDRSVGSGGSTSSTGAAPASNLDANSVLKRLM